MNLCCCIMADGGMRRFRRLTLGARPLSQAIEGLHGAWAEILHQLIDTTLADCDDIAGDTGPLRHA